MARFARILLVDDPAGTTVSTHELTRPAEPGEAHDFARLGEALGEATGLEPTVLEDLSPVGADDAAVIVHASRLSWLLGADVVGDLASRTIVVGAQRASMLPMLEVAGVAGVVEERQYFKWKAEQPADAAVFTLAAIASELDRPVEAKPMSNPAYACLRIDGEDLPGLIGAILHCLPRATSR